MGGLPAVLLCALGLLAGQGVAANVQLTACSEGMCTVAASGGDEASVHAWSVSGRVAVGAVPCTSTNGGAVTVTLRVARVCCTDWRGRPPCCHCACH